MIAIELSTSARDAVGLGARVLLIVVLALAARRAARRGVDRLVARMQARASETDTTMLARDDRKRRVEARTNTLSTVLNSQSAVVIYGLGALLVLAEIRVNLGPVLAGAGVAAAAIGFGAQSLVRDTLAGIFVLIEDQYGVGDIIDAGPATGTVERVTLRATQIRDLGGTVWHIPNGTILRVGNKSQNWARAVVEVTVAFDADVRQARRVMRDVAGQLAADPDWVGVGAAADVDEQGISSLTPNGVTLRLVVETEPASQWKVERELRQRIKEAFDAEGIPFEVHHQ